VPPPARASHRAAQILESSMLPGILSLPFESPVSRRLCRQGPPWAGRRAVGRLPAPFPARGAPPGLQENLTK
jgi:hypothetical protein